MIFTSKSLAGILLIDMAALLMYNVSGMCVTGVVHCSGAGRLSGLGVTGVGTGAGAFFAGHLRPLCDLAFQTLGVQTYPSQVWFSVEGVQRRACVSQVRRTVRIIH